MALSLLSRKTVLKPCSREHPKATSHHEGKALGDELLRGKKGQGPGGKDKEIRNPESKMLVAEPRR